MEKKEEKKVTDEKLLESFKVEELEKRFEMGWLHKERGGDGVGVGIKI